MERSKPLARVPKCFYLFLQILRFLMIFLSFTILELSIKRFKIISKYVT